MISMGQTRVSEILFFIAAFTVISDGIFLDHATKMCPEDCSCDDVSRQVACTGTFHNNMSSILSSTPRNTQAIILKNLKLQDVYMDLTAFPDLNALTLSGCQVTSVHFHIGPRGHRLRQLNLDDNFIEEIDFTEFGKLSHLSHLNVSRNHIQKFDSYVFHHMTNLEVLDLSWNELEEIPVEAFYNMSRLRSLYLNHNKIEFIHPQTLSYLSSVQVIHLHHNSIPALKNNTFDDLHHLEEIRLDSNPFDCHCGISWLADSLKTDPRFTNLNSTQCKSPGFHADKPVYRLTHQELICEKPVIHSWTSDHVVYYLHDVLLWCNATGVPAPSVYWITPRGQYVSHNSHHKYISTELHEHVQQTYSFAGGPTYFTSKVIGLDNGALKIEQARLYFIGRYTCVAENPAGVTNVTITIQMRSQVPQAFLMTLFWGGSAASGILFIGIMLGSLRWCVETMIGKKDGSMYGFKVPPKTPSKSPTPTSYYSPPVSRDGSPRSTSMQIIYEYDDEYDAKEHPHGTIRETLDDVRVRLRSGMEKQVGRLRSRAQNIRESSSQYMQSIKESSTHYVHTIKASGSQYANRVKAGVALGVEQVKYHVQSMKELCGTGDIGQTVSTVSISTNVDSQERSEVMRSVTIV